jgi:hypothetical protein
MVIVKLMGGLGNQMFQYACGRRLSFVRGVPLLLDTSFLESNDRKPGFTPRDFELDIFKLQVIIADKKLLAKYNHPSFFYRLTTKMLNYPRIITEQGRKMNTHVLDAPSAVYLQGYWQSEKYFRDIHETIREEFTFPADTENDYLSELFNLIRQTNSVAVHVRRGDYATDKMTNSVHGLLPTEYYLGAIRLIKQKQINPVFFVFSDDPQWVSESFPNEPGYVIINHKKPVRNYVDMMLMSACKHNIIANSSYSWWGAWLNNNPGKIVIAPEKWYTEGNNAEVIKDRIPEGWITI